MYVVCLNTSKSITCDDEAIMEVNSPWLTDSMIASLLIFCMCVCDDSSFSNDSYLWLFLPEIKCRMNENSHIQTLYLACLFVSFQFTLFLFAFFCVLSLFLFIRSSLMTRIDATDDHGTDTELSSFSLSFVGSVTGAINAQCQITQRVFFTFPSYPQTICFHVLPRKIFTCSLSLSLVL